MDIFDDEILYVAQRLDPKLDGWVWAFPEGYRSQSHDLPALRDRLLEEAEQPGDYRIIRTVLAVVEEFHFESSRATTERS